MIGTTWLRREKTFAALVGADRLHDLGALLFAFISFWLVPVRDPFEAADHRLDPAAEINAMNSTRANPYV